MSREAFVVDCILLESAARDIVGRLTALDDDTKNNRSFQTLFAALKREGLDSKRTKDLDAKIKEYRKLVNDLKVSHRNRYIAHVNTDEIGRAHVCTPVTNAHLVCRLLLEKKQTHNIQKQVSPHNEHAT